eukprot:scaffold1845_cov174-Amphora_coffeaeformis.AAC.5
MAANFSTRSFSVRKRRIVETGGLPLSNFAQFGSYRNGPVRPRNRHPDWLPPSRKSEDCCDVNNCQIGIVVAREPEALGKGALGRPQARGCASPRTMSSDMRRILLSQSLSDAKVDSLEYCREFHIGWLLRSLFEIDLG